MAGIKEQAPIPSSERTLIQTIRSNVKAALIPQGENLFKDYLIIEAKDQEFQAKIKGVVYPGESNKSSDVVIFRLDPYSGAGTVGGSLEGEPVRQFVSRGRLQGTPLSVTSACLRMTPDTTGTKVSNSLIMKSWGGREEKELFLNGVRIVIGSTVDPQKNGVKLCNGENLDPSLLPKK